VNREALDSAVRDAVSLAPLPARLDELDTHSRRQIERAAAAVGVSAQWYLDDARATQDQAALDRQSVDDLVATIRHIR
jgi:LmbE family N-acetylglucosaminyl deacetylase